MARLKVGRNDPCPCGSGKKYKKCCGMLADFIDSTDDSFTRSNKLMTAVKLKLDNYFGNAIKKIRQDTQKQFLRFTVNQHLPQEHESIFSDWLWFDLLTKDENTLAYLYLNENGTNVEASLRDCLGALSISFPSIYEVEEVRDNYLKANDILLDRSCDILLKEPWDGVNGETKLLLLGRLVLVEDENIFSGMVLAVDNKAGQKEFLMEHMHFIRELLNDTIINVLKFHNEMLYGVFDHAYHKTLVNFNDIRSCEINEEERNNLLTHLSSDKDLVHLHDSAGFNWFQPTGEHRGYVRLVAGENDLICCADVLEDIVRLQEKVSTILPGKEWQVLSNRFLQQPPPADKNHLWFTIIKDQETERWLDSTHSELNNKTPREFLIVNKEKVFRMLDEFQASRKSELEQELVEYMKLRINN
jgi:hypothetical protein